MLKKIILIALIRIEISSDPKNLIIVSNWHGNNWADAQEENKPSNMDIDIIFESNIVHSWCLFEFTTSIINVEVFESILGKDKFIANDCQDEPGHG